jgi:hypothetical protein
MTIALRSVLVALVVWSATACQSSAQTRSKGDGRLLVILVVDQMRFEYLDRYKAFWKDGFERLLDDGAVFERAAYPYLNTVTCTGHATIATGAFPYKHGIILNEWWQRAAGRRMSCTEDPAIKSVPYSREAERIGHSAHRLRVPTLGDRLRAASPESRVVTLSMKPRSAAMLAGGSHARQPRVGPGRGGSAVTWFAQTNAWATSTAYARAPVPEVQAYVNANPIDRLRGEIWNRVYDPSAYSGVDDGIGERPPSGWTPLFAHPLSGAPGTSRERFYDLWERSPYSDEMLGDMAATLVQTMRLGQRGVVDLLGVSFSALDYVGHDFGPNSHEVQDTLVRLDRTIGRFLAALDKTLGEDGYVIGLSTDHGVGEIPEAARAAGGDAGRVVNREIHKIAEAAMVKAHGPGPHVAHVEYTELYLTDAARKRVAARPAALQPLVDALSRLPAVLRALPTAGLDRKRTSQDPIERAAAFGHVPGESGDVQVILKRDWISSDTSAATHGSLHPYDQHVPVIFFGDGIKEGRFSDPATPADIAPTLASLVKLNLPGTDGKVLRNAVK